MSDEAHSDLPTEADIAAIVAPPAVETPPPAPAPAAPAIEAPPAAQAPKQPGTTNEEPGTEAPNPGDPPPPDPAPADVTPHAPAKVDEFGVPVRMYTKNLTREQRALMGAALQNPDATPDQVRDIANRKLGIAPEPGTKNKEPETPSAALAAVDAELAEIQTFLAEQAESDGIGTVFNKQINEKLSRQAELKAERMMLARDAKAAAEQAAATETSAVDTVIQSAEAAYPDLQVEGSPMLTAANDRIAELTALEAQAQTDPSILSNPDVNLALAQFRHPNFARILADEVARDLGISPVQAQPNGSKAPTTSPQQGGPQPPANGHPQAKPGMVPVGSGSSAAHRVQFEESSPLSRFQASIKNADPDDLAAVEASLGELAGASGDSRSVRFR